jgi:hypothetical protein
MRKLISKKPPRGRLAQTKETEARLMRVRWATKRNGVRVAFSTYSRKNLFPPMLDRAVMQNSRERAEWLRKLPSVGELT